VNLDDSAAAPVHSATQFATHSIIDRTGRNLPPQHAHHLSKVKKSPAPGGKSSSEIGTQGHTIFRRRSWAPAGCASNYLIAIGGDDTLS